MNTSKHNHPIRNRLIAVLGLSLGLAASVNPLLAADITWDGGGDGSSWSASPANWVGDVAPVATDRLFFDGAVGLTPNNDFAASTVFNGITFNSGAGAFVLSGNTVNIGGGVTNNSATLQTISLNLTVPAARDFVLTGDMICSGGINTSGGRIVKSGPGTLTLAGTTDNAFGATTINQGTVILAKTSTGTVAALGGDSTVNTNGILVFSGTGANQVFSGASIIMNGGKLQMQETNLTEEIKMLRGTNPVSVVENGLAGSTNVLRVGGGRNSHGIYGGILRDGSAGVLGFAVQLSGNWMVLTGTNNTYSGVTTVNANDGSGTSPARLIVDGSHVGGGAYGVSGHATVTANQGVVGGKGIISAAAINLGANTALSPGGALSSDLNTATFSDTTAILTISNAVNLNTTTATLDVQLNGTNAATSYDQVIIAGSGTFSNNNANLKITLGYSPQNGDKFTIVQVPGTSAANNVGVFTSLNGVTTSLSQGTTFVEPSSGQNFQISYRAEGATFDAGAGNGNDIMLRVVSSAGTNLTWRGDLSYAWDITSTANWRNSGGTAMTFTNGDNVTFNDTGSNAAPIDLTTDLNPGNIVVNATKDYVFGTSTAGKLTGVVVLTKTNTGTLTILTDNDNGGSTILRQGKLQIGTNGTSGTLSGALTINTNGALVHNRSDDVTFATALSGSGSFVHTGGGALILSADSTFTGRTTNSGGMLQLGTGVGNVGSIGGDINVSDPEELRYYYAGDANILNTRSGNGTVIFEAASGNRTFTIPTTVISSNFTGSNVLTAGVRLHAADNSSTYAFGNGGSIFVPDLAQAWCDRSTVPFNQEFYIAGSGWTGVARPTGAISVFGCTLTGPIHLLADARIGGTISGGTILGAITGSYQLEIWGNAGSYVLSLGPTNGVNNYSSTLITEGSVRALNTNALSTGPLTMDMGADLRLNGNNLTVASLTSINSGNVPAGTGATIQNISGSASATLTVGTDGTSTTFDGTFANGSSRPLGLTKVGAGTLTLSAVNASTGPVAVNGGTLTLTGLGAFGSASNISVAAGATLDVSGRSDGTLTLNSGQTLSGSGTVTGLVVSAASSTVSPGASVGTLTVSGDVTLGGTLYLELNKTNAQTSDKLVSSGGTITYGGALSVKNIGPTLEVGDSFQLFTNAVTGFGSIVLSPTDDSGAVYTWTNKVAIDGSIQVIGVTERIYAVTIANQLISFGSSAPGTVLSGVSLTGLQSGEQVVGIDFQNNTLYALGSSSRLYTINRTTGAATAVGGQFSPILNGTVYGMEVGPAGVRVVTDLKQNLLLDTTTGAATDLAALNGTPDPTISGLAYHPGTGQHYAADYVQNSIGTFNPATGFVTNIGTTTIDFSRNNGFDISAGTANTAYIATPASSSGDAANLYTVNLGTGVESLVGLIGNIGDNYLIRGLAVGPDFSTAPAINPNPTNITFTASGGNLNLSWPASHLGWILQSQINLRSVGLKTNWVDIAGSGLVTATNIPINKTDPTVFFRLRKP